jgi:hypothetical protein
MPQRLDQLGAPIITVSEAFQSIEQRCENPPIRHSHGSRKKSPEAFTDGALALFSEK